MADIFTILVDNLNKLGFYNFLLPWLFVFAVVYGLLAKVNIFGGQNNRISALIGFIAAFFAVSYYGEPLAAFFTGLFGGATIILAGILVVVLFIAMAGFKLENITDVSKWGTKLGLLLIIVIGIVVFMVATGTTISGIQLNEEALAAIFIIIIILLALWFVTGGKEEKVAAPAPGRAP